MGQKPNACCNEAGNLFVESSGRKISGMMAGKPVTGTVTVRKCKVCGCRHHEVAPEPGRLGLASK